ncbi:RNA-binding protein 25-like [Palaemon carinicauda]|uniref:RNA-binding protein 25-like n=1 Tax=Palaemon carinicauda TaxID=392227 RepID=UPI0035B59E21
MSSAVRSKRSLSGGEEELAISVSQDTNFKMLQEMQQKLSSFMKGYQPTESSSLNTKRRKAESRRTLGDKVSKRFECATTHRDDWESKHSSRKADLSGFQEVERSPYRAAVHALSSDCDRSAESAFKRSARRNVERALERPPVEHLTERERPPRRDIEHNVRSSTERERPPRHDVECNVRSSTERERPPERDVERDLIERSKRKRPSIERSAERERDPRRPLIEHLLERKRCYIDRPCVCDAEQQTSRQDFEHNTTLLNSERADRERSEEQRDLLSEEEVDVPLSPSEPFEELSEDEDSNPFIIR